MSIDELHISPAQRQALLEAKRRLQSAFPVESLVMYGSVARGNATEESDIDVLVITHKKMSHKQRHDMCDIIFEVNLAYGTTLSILVVDRETWRTGLWSVLPIRQEIDHEGIFL